MSFTTFTKKLIITGVEVISVSVGKEVNYEHLFNYASKVSSIYNVSSFDELKSVKNDIVSNACTG